MEYMQTRGDTHADKRGHTCRRLAEAEVGTCRSRIRQGRLASRKLTQELTVQA